MTFGLLHFSMSDIVCSIILLMNTECMYGIYVTCIFGNTSILSISTSPTYSHNAGTTPPSYPALPLPPQLPPNYPAPPPLPPLGQKFPLLHTHNDCNTLSQMVKSHPCYLVKGSRLQGICSQTSELEFS